MIIRKAQTLIACLLLVAPAAVAYDIPGYTPDRIIPFKQTVNSSGGAITLNLHVFTPPGHQPSHQRPAIVFFFGGAWVDGSPSHFHPQCEYLASRGMVAISAEYRVKNLHGTTPQECVKDGKSAIRYVRQNAAALGVDPNRIAAGGGSAGGHVAAAAGTLTAYEEPAENPAISSKPNALVLYNPVVDNGPGGWGYDTVQAYWQTISPLHNIDASAPPTTFFLGTSDALVPVSVGKNYQAAMATAGRRCDLHLYQGQPHSFFNFDVPDDGSGPFYGYRDTLFKTDEFLVSLGWLADPHDAPAPASGWVTILGDAGFSANSAATASPVTSDANGDAIAANIGPADLTDGGFVRLTGTVTFNAPLTGDKFRIGLFDGDNPVTTGDGSGYTGIWAGAPATADTSIAAGNGTGSHPFEIANSTTLGPMPAAAAIVPANTPVDFTLMIARNGDKLDISARFTDRGSYNPSQNLLNLTAANHAFDSVAFLMDSNLNATRASFSNIGITRGTVLPSAGLPDEPPPPTLGPITYLDASVVTGGNTFLTSNPADSTWLNTTQNSATTNNTQWVARYGENFGINDNTLQSAASAGNFPQITTRLAGLADGNHIIWGFFWEQVVSTTQNWGISAGLNSGSLTTYSAPLTGHSRGGTNTVDVTNAKNLTFTTTPKLEQVFDAPSGSYLQNLFGAKLGQVTVSGGSAVDVFIDNNLVGTSNWRVAYDGVGYQRVNGETPAPVTTTTRLLGIDFNCDDVLGSPSQAGFRVVAGSAANQAANASSYTKTIGAHQVTISQPAGSSFEFRGANGDNTRAIPGGDTSRSFLLSDFIATREGAIDIRISGLAAGDYLFRSWHLDPLTGNTRGFAQGVTTTTPNLIEAQVGGVTRDAVEPTALGSAGINSTFINNSQVPTIDFPIRHDGGSPLTIRLRAIDSNGGERFLLLNGFELSTKNP
jgi:acetyl esterase/lipase